MKNKSLNKIISILRENIKEEGSLVLPTNNVGSGKIAGTPQADPNNPPVFLKKRKDKKYIYKKNSRKYWLDYLKTKK